MLSLSALLISRRASQPELRPGSDGASEWGRGPRIRQPYIKKMRSQRSRRGLSCHLDRAGLSARTIGQAGADGARSARQSIAVRVATAGPFVSRLAEGREP